jgi:phosphotransacetylase
MSTLTLNLLITQAKKLAPLITAVVHPCSIEALAGAINATEANLINPILMGPTLKIKQVAEQLKVDISKYHLINTEHSHAAAEQAVALARSGKVQQLMKGSLHTDELMHAAVAKDHGIRTDRQMSHVFIAETPSYPKILFLTDCAININPNLMAKRDIIQNAIDLAHAINLRKPKIAILSAIETVSDKLQSTIDAAALCKMADRKQIIGGELDGPLAFDNAISIEAAKIKLIESPVAGKADILVAPDLEAGNMIVKQLQYFAKAKLAGIVLGARVPIVLTSRADNAQDRLASCALGSLYYQHIQKGKLCKTLY